MDRTKCSNDTCTLRLNCLRFTGKASEYQSYTRFEPVDNKCEYFISVEAGVKSNYRFEYLDKKVKSKSMPEILNEIEQWEIKKK
jgi:hypothetical protein